jgi:hypothetical protein
MGGVSSKESFIANAANMESNEEAERLPILSWAFGGTMDVEPPDVVVPVFELANPSTDFVCVRTTRVLLNAPRPIRSVEKILP